jgi:hypothetical protein
LYGLKWIGDSWKFIQEDRATHYRMLQMLLPLARSPMDKKSAQGMSSYAKKVDRVISGMVPWQKATSRTAHLRGKVKPGEVVIMLDGDESLDSSFIEGVKVVRE